MKLLFNSLSHILLYWKEIISIFRLLQSLDFLKQTFGQSSLTCFALGNTLSGAHKPNRELN